MGGPLRAGRGALRSVAAFSGPAFSGPAFSGPAFSGPAFSGPAFSGPAFSGPAVTWPPVTGPDLKGFTVAITADRRRDEQAVLMERLGLEVLMFPLLQTQPEDLASLRALTEQVVREPPDYLLANTGYGMRTWLALTAQWGLQEDLVSSVRARTAIAARGAKALGEIRKVGLDAWYKAPGETLEEVVARLTAEDLVGRSVVVQLHGEPAGSSLADLDRAGARVSYLPVYRMGGAGEEAVAALIETLLDGAADAVTFTAAPQVQALTGAARAGGVLAPVLEGFNADAVVAACIGPVCAGIARSEGISEPLVPLHSRLGALATAVGTALAERQVVLAGKSGPVAISGRLVEARGEQRWVGRSEQRLLRLLCADAGQWVDLKVVAATSGAGAFRNAVSGLVDLLDGAVDVAGGSARLVTA
jgi:uroporphyrinogen-III synthase